jgi:hypothetical protein
MCNKESFCSKFAYFDGCMRREKWVALIVEDRKGKIITSHVPNKVEVFLSIFMGIDDSIVTVHKRESRVVFEIFLDFIF